MVEPASEATENPQTGTVADDDYEPTPWHFKLMLLGLILYLVYRGYQLVAWLLPRLF
jgi:hypothetical protein